MKVVDTFSFFNEMELLEIRLHELWDVVDQFVIVEANKTHSGLDKPFNLSDNWSRFSKYAEKMVYVPITNMPMTPEEIQASISIQDRKWLDTGYQMGDNWCRERFQRNSIMVGLKALHLSLDDWVIISDADEIVRASVVEQIKNENSNKTYAIKQRLYSGYLNVECTNMDWYGSKIMKYRYVTNPSEHRFHTLMDQAIIDGGWHWMFLGGKDRIKQKIQSYAHQEFAIPDVLDNIETRLGLGKDVLGRLYEYRKVPIDDSYPKYILENLDKFDNLILKG